MTQERGGPPSRLVSFVSRRWFPLLLVLGAGLRIGLFLQNRSLWVDEARLALNILGKTPLELLGPLEFDQAAPPGFLLLVKAAERILGSSEFALRFVPLIWGLASLPLFFCLARRKLRPAAAPLACLLFAIAEPLVYFSTELKQYSSDVALELALWTLASRVAEPLRPSRLAALGLAGAAALFLSHTAIFVLGGVGLALLLGNWPARGKQGLAGLALTFCLWGAALAGVYALSLHHLTGNARIIRYFTERAAGFPPAGVFSEIRWLIGRLLELFRFPGGLDHGGIPAFCAVVGTVAVFRRERSAFVMWIAPGALSLLAALARLYPFEGRLILFVVPALYLLVAEGAQEVLLRTRPGGVLLAGTLIFLLLLHPVAAALDGVERPRYFEQIRPVLEHVSRARRSGDVVYLYYAAQYAVRYYMETRRLSVAEAPTSELLAPTARVATGAVGYEPALVSRPPSFYVGSDSRGDSSRYRRELDALAGHPRVWILFSHIVTWSSADERRPLLDHLDRIGTRLEAFEEPGASAYLYDLRALRSMD